MTMAVVASATASARDFEMGGDNNYSIMAPEPGTHRPHTVAASAPRPRLLGHEKFVAKLHRGQRMYATRGSSGVVLPTPVPKTELIPPEGSDAFHTPALPQQQGRTILPGTTTSIPNLPHGPESFQDRASRCAHQTGVYGVPNGTVPQYMAACAM